MKLLKRIQQYRVYRRMVLSYLILIVLSVVIVSAVLYSLFSARAVKEIDNSSKQMLSQVSFTANVVYKQIQDVTGQLLIDNNIDAFLHEGEVNKVTNLKAYLIISKVQSVYPFIANISLYNFMNDEYIDTAGLPRDPIVATEAQREYLGFYPRQVQKDEHTHLQLLTFRIVKEWRVEANTPKSALVIDIDESYIQNTIGKINESIRNADTFVMDSTGKILSHSDSDYFMDDFSKMEYLLPILSGTENQGSFIRTINRQRHLVTYVKSSTLDWFFVTVRPYNELLTDIHTLRNWTLVIAIFLIICGAVGSFLLTGNIYNPIRVLVDRVMEMQGMGTVKKELLSGDEYTLLSQAFKKTMETTKLQEMILSQSKQVLKSSTIVSILKGIDSSTLTQIEREWEDRLKGPFITVILIKVDAIPSHNENYSALDRELIRFATGNIAKELLDKNYDNDLAIMENEVAFILQSHLRYLNDELHLTLSEIQDAIQAYYGITVSISIGDWCESFTDLRRSYRSAQEYIAYRLFFGRSSIIDSERTIQDRNIEERYPQSKERKLIEAVKLCNVISIRDEIEEWIQFIAHCSYSQAMQYTNFLFIAIFREFETITKWWEIDTNKLYAETFQIRYFETMDELNAALSELCIHIVTTLEENRKNVSMSRNVKVIEEAKLLIYENYADPNLSLEFVAGKAGLSAGYLGKLFRSNFHMSYNDYVTSVRLDHAKRRLITTNYKVADIAVGVGILGFPYFSTLFKKHVGMSPSQYRDNQKTKSMVLNDQDD